MGEYFSDVALPNFNNPLADFYAAGKAESENSLAREHVQAAHMANAYTSATQPAQIALSQSTMNALADSYNGTQQGGAAPAPTDTSGAAPADPARGASLLAGDTPVSADPETQREVGEEARRQGVNPEWAMRTHFAESGAAKTPYGPGSTSDADAAGPMQLMAGTAKDLGVDRYEKHDNIKGGVTYLAQLKQKYGNPVLATAAYNAGPGRVDDFLAGKSSLPPETVSYVGKVFGNGDGASLLHSAFAGDHGHPIAGVQPAGGLQPVAADAAATAATRQLVMMGRYYSAMPDGKGARAAAAIQAQLDNIAGPGGIVDPRTGNVYRVPGSYATRFAASNATKSGEVGPETVLASNKGVIDEHTHAANAGVDVAAKTNEPVKLSPGETLTTPATVGVGAPPIPNQNRLLPIAQPAAPFAPQPATAQPTVAAPSQPAAPAPDATPAGVYQAPANPAVAAATQEGDNSVKMQQPILDQAKESQNALNRIGQIRAAMKQSTENGLPPGFFSPALAQGVAAAKSLGINLSSLGISPEAIQNEQVAREALTQINGEILKRMFPQRITNADVSTFGANLANYGMDPSALEPILNQAEQSARYDVGKSDDLLSYKQQHGNAVGWDSQFYKKNGYGPNLFDAVKSGTVPASGGKGTPAPATAQQSYSLDSPFKGDRAQIMALPKGTPFLNPATGKVMLRH